MKRKIIKQANQAFTITLPIEWVRSNKLNEKSEIDLEIIGKSIVINSGNTTSGGKIELDVGDFQEKEIGGILNALYAKGIDEIIFNSPKDISTYLTKSLSQNMGYALIEQKKDLFVIRDIKGSETHDLDEIFKRVFQIVILFYESAIKDVFGESKEKLETINSRDSEVNKFCLYLQRAINKKEYPESVKGRALFTYSFMLEKIGDEVTRFWRANVEHKIKKNSKIKDLAELSLEELGSLFDAYHNSNLKKINEAFKIRNKLREEALKLDLDSKQAELLRHVMKISEECTDLNQLNIMINTEEKK